MAVAFRASNLAGNGTATSVTNSYPTGTATGDYVVAILYKENTAAVTVTPSDWVLLENGNNVVSGAAFNGYVYVRKFTSGDANPNFAWTGSVWTDLQLRSYSGSTATGADGSDGHNKTVNANSTDTTASEPAITTAIDQDIDLLTVTDFNGVNCTYPSGWINAAGNGRDANAADKAGVTAGSQASQSVTLSAATSYVAVQVAIKNANAAAGLPPGLGPDMCMQPGQMTDAVIGAF